LAALIGCYASQAQTDEGAENADDGCILTSANIEFAKGKYLRNKNFRSVTWDDKTRTAHVVTKDGEPLTIQNWACENLAVEGALSIRANAYSSLRHLQGKALWLGQQLLDREDLGAFRRALEGKSFRSWNGRAPLKLTLKGTYYSFIILEITVTESTAVIRLYAETPG
jgi:hypothetical protein